MNDASRSGPGLKRAIFIRSGGLIVLLAVGVWLASSVFVVRDQRNDERNEVRAMVEFFAPRLESMPHMSTVPALTSLLHELVDNHFSIAYAIVENDGVPIAHTFGRDPIPLRDETRPTAAEQTVTVRVVEDRGGRSFYDASSPLRQAGVTLRIGTARPELDDETKGVLKSIAAGSVIAMLLGVGLAWMVAVMTTREVSQAESALRESEERYRLLFDQAPDSIMLMDVEPGRAPVIREANEVTSRMHGIPLDQIIGQPVTVLDTPEDGQHAAERTRRIMSGEVFTFEAEHLRADGSTFPVEVIARMIEINGRPAIQAIDRDISDRRRAEEEKRSLEAQLQQSQKMEAIGRLAGGIAHDMNNVLAAIMGAASILDDELGPQHPQHEIVSNLLAACTRGRELTRNFLGYARKGKYAPEALDLNQLVVETRDLLIRTIPKTVVFETSLDLDLGVVHGDRSLINQALMNVCINAVDAVEDSGTVSVVSEAFELTEDEVANWNGFAPGRFARLVIRDTGAGMDAETISRAFEPFFTTKPSGKGTGLGLAMVHGAMKSHGGEVFIRSAPGSGTTVTLVLPATEGRVVADDRSVSPVAEPHPAAGLILLVEDEKLVAWTGKTMLERMGYRVEVARDGRQAITAFERSASEIGLVILDLVMPEMDGRSAFFELRRIDPSVRVLLSTGFSHDETVEELLRAGACGFIEKPYDKEALGEAVAAALRGCRPDSAT